MSIWVVSRWRNAKFSQWCRCAVTKAMSLCLASLPPWSKTRGWTRPLIWWQGKVPRLVLFQWLGATPLLYKVLSTRRQPNISRVTMREICKVHSCRFSRLRKYRWRCSRVVRGPKIWVDSHFLDKKKILSSKRLVVIGEKKPRSSSSWATMLRLLSIRERKALIPCIRTSTSMRCQNNCNKNLSLRASNRSITLLRLMPCFGTAIRMASSTTSVRAWRRLNWQPLVVLSSWGIMRSLCRSCPT